MTDRITDDRLDEVRQTYCSQFAPEFAREYELVEILDALAAERAEVERLMRHIAEWMKGCTDAPPPHPGRCATCTQAFIDAVARRSD